MSQISNIDDLLAGGQTSTQTPETPEHYEANKQSQDDFKEDDHGKKSEISKELDNESTEENITEEGEEQEEDGEQDEYGNKKPKDNEIIRDRLARQAESLKRQHQAELEALRRELTDGQSHEVKQASKEFEYDPNLEGDWQQQLKAFVRQTIKEASVEEQRSQAIRKEKQAQAEFETKFRTGMANFDDFVDVVGSLPITDAMTVATRSMKDPAAFLYAAAKRHPQELQRIASIPDQYAQMVEIGKLEERMRVTKTTTNAPKPVSRSKEDLPIKHQSKKGEPTIEELIAQSENTRLNRLQQRRR